MTAARPPKRSRVVDEAKRRLADRVRALSPAERILLALELGDDCQRLARLLPEKR